MGHLPSGEKLQPPRKTQSLGLWRDSDRTRKQRMGEEAKCIVAMQLARRLSRSVCVQGAPSTLSLRCARSWCSKFSAQGGSGKSVESCPFVLLQSTVTAGTGRMRTHLINVHTRIRQAPVSRTLNLALQRKVCMLYNVLPAHELLVLKVVSSICQTLCGCRQLNTALSPGSRRSKKGIWLCAATRSVFVLKRVTTEKEDLTVLLDYWSLESERQALIVVYSAILSPNEPPD